jgi:hypothetical protein
LWLAAPCCPAPCCPIWAPPVLPCPMPPEPGPSVVPWPMPPEPGPSVVPWPMPRDPALLTLAPPCAGGCHGRLRACPGTAGLSSGNPGFSSPDSGPPSMLPPLQVDAMAATVRALVEQGFIVRAGMERLNVESHFDYTYRHARVLGGWMGGAVPGQAHPLWCLRRVPFPLHAGGGEAGRAGAWAGCWLGRAMPASSHTLTDWQHL